MYIEGVGKYGTNNTGTFNYSGNYGGIMKVEGVIPGYPHYSLDISPYNKCRSSNAFPTNKEC